jgi:hypothetical protein
MNKIKTLLFVLLLVGLFTACQPVPETDASSSATAVLVTDTLAPTLTPMPSTLTPTITMTPTVAISATPTLDAEGITLINFDFRQNQSSTFQFAMNYSSGDYYATGRLQDGTLLPYNCSFLPDQPSTLHCSGGVVPFNGRVNFQLYQQDTNQMIFSEVFLNNVLTHGEILPSPTGVICEIEPQWNGFKPDHQLSKGCFAMSCWQNGKFLWGSDNTCINKWPFPWDFTHPLHTPGT